MTDPYVQETCEIGLKLLAELCSNKDCETCTSAECVRHPLAEKMIQTK